MKHKKCPRCHGEMKEGQALQNTAPYGTPDFPGQKDLSGQTFSFSGDAVLIKCLKCKECGYSIQW